LCVFFLHVKYIYIHLPSALASIWNFGTDSDAKLEVLDEDFVKELVGDEGNADASKKEEIAKKQRKQLAKLEIRLAQEKKAAAKQAGMTKKEKKAQKAQEESEIDEDEAMLMFAKGSRVISTGKKTK
jgi:hypothetical protein